MPPWLRRTLGLIAVVGALVAFELGVGAAFDPYIQRVLAVCGINVMLAVALNLVAGTTGQFSIGHAGFMAVGAYAGAVTSFTLGPAVHTLVPGGVGDGVTLLAALVAGTIAAGIAGVAVGVPSLRLRGDYLAIVTLGFGEIIRIVLEATPAIGGARGYPTGSSSLAPLATLGWIAGGAVVAIVLARNLTYSTHGRALAAIRDDELAAEAVGIPTTRYKVLAFAISAMMTGAAGVFFAHDATGGQHLDPRAFGLDRSVDMLVMVIFGGLGSVTGAVLGGLFVAVSLEALRELPALFGTGDSTLVHTLRDDAGNVRLIVYALILIGMMLLRPQGLLGTRELSWRWWPGRRKARP